MRRPEFLTGSTGWHKEIRETQKASDWESLNSESITAPGYRVYYTRKGSVLIVVLCGGDKDSQSKDIERARQIAANLKEEDLIR
jgi:hypothetical protein